jgi:hypothetical protein
VAAAGRGQHRESCGERGGRGAHGALAGLLPPGHRSPLSAPMSCMRQIRAPAIALSSKRWSRCDVTIAGGQMLQRLLAPMRCRPLVRAAARCPRRASNAASAGRHLRRNGRVCAAGKLSWWRGSGRWSTGPLMAHCPPAVTSAASMAGTSSGAGSSSGQDWPASWTPRLALVSVSHLNGGTDHRLGVCPGRLLAFRTTISARSGRAGDGPVMDGLLRLQAAGGACVSLRPG